MAEQIQINALIRPELDTGGIVKKVSSIQALLKKVNLPPSLQKEFDGLFTDFNSSIEKINGQFSKGFETKGAVKSLDSMSAEMRGTVEKITQAWQQVSSRGDLIKLPPDQDKKLKQINIEIQQLRTKINQVNPNALEQVTQAIDQLKGKAGQRTGSEVMELIDQGEAQQAINLLDIIIAKREKMSLTAAESKAGETFRADTLALTQMRDALLNAETETKDLVTQLEQLDADGAKILTQAMDDLGKEIKETETDTTSLNQGLEKTEGSMRGAAQGAQEMSSEMDEIKNRIKYFFSLSNAVQLVRQALRQTFEAAKELDAAMTETAVVTDFSVGDMWDMLPEYTKTAQELGATTKGVYETLTLFYQQGLDTNEAMALGVETLKMARIAGMDYEEATSKMTAALRGFNMELDEASAKRVNDVYSELAAITAADTDQIATAMTKTASIANSANMEFETTAAFLSQIIETTQESAETAGTAMKTVIARFTELKKDPSLIGEVDGEVIDANKIETALNTIGVALRDNLTGQFRDLDDVFLDIAQKWEGLDTNTQRYIATIAAGSRQQSRFIAMMSDYERTMELVGAANDSAGSSQAQFDKTLESMEAKLNQLKNTWQEFTLGLMDSSLLKLGIDALNGLLSVINKLTDAPGILGGASKAFLSFFLLFTGKKLFNVFEGVLSSQIKSFQSGGKVAAMTWGQSFDQEFKKTKVNLQKNFKGLFSFTGKDGKVLTSFIPKGAAKQFNDLAVAQEKANQSTSLLNKAMIKYGVTSDQLENLETANITTTERRVLTQLKLRNAFDSNDASQAKEILEQTGVAKAYDLSNDQMMEYLGIKKLGVSTDLAAAAAKAGVTKAQLKENAAMALSIPLDRELTAEEEKQLAVEMRNQLLRQQGILVRLKEKVIKVGSTAITKLETAAIKDNTAGIIANWLAQKLLNKEMLAGTVIIAAVVAVIALLVAGVAALVKAYQNWSQQDEIAEQRTANAAQAAKDAAQAYDDLKNSIENLKGLENTLTGLEKGTAEWKKTVAELNQQVLELLKIYPFLSKFISNKNGAFSISAEGYDELLEHQAGVVQQAIAIHAANFIAEQRIKQERGQDSYSKKIEELYPEISGWASNNKKSGYITTQVTNADGTQTTDKVQQFDTGSLSKKDIEELVNEYRKTGQIDIENKLFSKQNWSDVTTTIDDASIIQIEGAIKEIANALDDFGEQIKIPTQSLIANANDLSKYTDTEVKLINHLMSDEISNRKWIGTGFWGQEKEVEASDDKIVWKAYQDMLEAQDSTYDYEIKNKTGTKATVTRTKNGITEYQTEDNEWSQEKQIRKVSQKNIFETVRAYKQGLFTEEDNKKIDTFLGNLNKLPPKIKDITETLIDSGLYAGSDIQKWFDENGDLTTQFFEDIDAFEEKYGSIEVAAAKKSAEIAEQISNTFVESSNSLLLELGEGKALSEIDSEKLTSVSGQLGTIKGLYDENKTAAEEWADLTNKGSVAQAAYLLNIQQSLRQSANEEQIQAAEKYQEEIEELQSQIDKDLELGLDTQKAEEQLFKMRQGYHKLLDDIELNPIEVDLAVDGILGYADSITSALSVIDEGFKTNRESFEGLMETFPEVLNGATVLANGEIQLNEQVLKSAVEKRKGEMESSADAQIAQIKDAMESAIAQRDALQATYEFMSNTAVKSAILQGRSYDEILAAAGESFKGQSIAGGIAYQTIKTASQSAETQQTEDADEVGSNLTQSINQAEEASWRAYGNMIDYTTKFRFSVNDAVKSVDALARGDVNSIVSGYKTYGFVKGTTKTYTSTNEGKTEGLPEVKLDIPEEEIRQTLESAFSSLNMSKDYYTTRTEDENYKSFLGGLEVSINDFDDLISSYSNQIVRLEAGKIEASTALDRLMAGGTIKGDSKSSSGSGKDESWKYERDYDENIKSQINAADEKLSKLEAEFESLLNDENATIEDMIAKKLEMAKVDAEKIKLIEEQIKLDQAEVERLKKEHLEWAELAYIDENGSFQVDRDAVNARGFTKEQGEEFEKWVEDYSTAQENVLASNLDYITTINEATERLKTITNEFDQIYNNELKIDGLQRKRSKLETEYNNILSKNNNNVQGLIDNLSEQYESLKKEQELLEQNHNLSQLQLDSFLGSSKNQAFQDYYNYDKETNRFEINVEAMEKLAAFDEELYNVVSDFLETAKSYWEDSVEWEEKLLDNTKAIAEKQKEAEESFDNLQIRLYDEIINYMEHEIEVVEELYSSINDSNERILDSISESLAQQRQDRQNAETEAEINDMRNRLAYLQMDTSGANQNEILNLQKQIGEKEQDYTDTLIDQKIDELQKQNDFAAEQRERQIQLLQWGHEDAQLNGSYLKSAKEALNSLLINNGDLNKAFYGTIGEGDDNSPLKKIFPNEKSVGEIISDNLLADTGKMPTQSQTDENTLTIGDQVAKALVRLQELRSAPNAVIQRTVLRVAQGLDKVSDLDYYIYDLDKDGKVTVEDAKLWLEGSVGLASLPKYATGGIADYTGPAWLDGTKSRPELVLNQQDTQNFLRLRDVLSQFMSNNNFKDKSSENSGDNYYEIHLNVEKITSDYDVEQLANKVKLIIAEDANSRGVNSIYRRR